MGLYDGYDIYSLTKEELNQIYKEEHDRITQAYYVDKTMTQVNFESQHTQIWIDRSRAFLETDKIDDIEGLNNDLVSIVFNGLERHYLLDPSHIKYLDKSIAIARVKDNTLGLFTRAYPDFGIDGSSADYTWRDNLISQVESKMEDYKSGTISIDDLLLYRHSTRGTTINLILSFLKGLIV